MAVTLFVGLPLSAAMFHKHIAWQAKTNEKGKKIVSKYFSNLKNIYKKTYEELKNPNSHIGIFLAKIDEYDFLDNAVEIRTAITDYIKIFEQEEKNFKEPDTSDGRVSYRAEQERLRKNLEVEKKLSEAVQKMHDALDVFAEASLKPRENYTSEQIKKMTDRKEQLRHQRDRMLNAAYNLELDLENKMIEKLKSEYRAFDHRPIESKVDTPPFVRNSPHYRIRHMELNGNLKVPTALYGLMRFRDLLNDHESLIEEAERSRQYEKFVNDRLAGYQAWKNTLAMETKVYHEISSFVDEKYFENYNKFMDDYPVTSSLQGYRVWYSKTYKSIQEKEKQIKQYEEEQKLFDHRVVELQEDLENMIAEDKKYEASIDEEIKKIENDPTLTESFYVHNETIRTVSEKELEELENELQELEQEMGALDEEQNVARKAMLEHPPLVKKANGEFTYMKSRAGLVLAGMPLLCLW